MDDARRVQPVGQGDARVVVVRRAALGDEGGHARGIERPRLAGERRAARDQLGVRGVVPVGERQPLDEALVVPLLEVPLVHGDADRGPAAVLDVVGGAVDRAEHLADLLRGDEGQGHRLGERRRARVVGVQREVVEVLPGLLHQPEVPLRALPADRDQADGRVDLLHQAGELLHGPDVVVDVRPADLPPPVDLVADAPERHRRAAGGARSPRACAAKLDRPSWLQYSTHRAASSAVPLPALAQM